VPYRASHRQISSLDSDSRLRLHPADDLPAVIDQGHARNAIRYTELAPICILFVSHDLYHATCYLGPVSCDLYP
jgi:hypothetical protein